MVRLYCSNVAIGASVISAICLCVDVGACAVRQIQAWFENNYVFTPFPPAHTVHTS